MKENGILHVPDLYRRNRNEDSHPHGVAIIVLNGDGFILLQQQRFEKSHYGRAAGQWNILTETGNPHERPDQTALRAVTEELGATFNDFQFLQGSLRKSTKRYTEELGYPFDCACMVLRYTRSCDNPNLFFKSHDGEVSAFAWVHPAELDSFDIETGAKMAIEYYFNS